MPGKTSKQSNEIVARIDYPFSGESFEYTNVDKFVEDVKKDNYSGVPMALVLFADKNGNTIPHDFLRDLDPPPQGLTVSYVNVSVYYPSYEQACANGEEAQYRGSMNVTQACKRAIARVISEHYDDHRLAPDAVNGVIDRFGLERTMCVLANTIRELDWDARFNTVNKQWAAGIQIPDNPGMPFATVNSHPGLVDLFTNSVRRCYVRSLPLTEADIHAEAERILHGFREADKPNSPNGSHYMVKIADDFMTRVRGQQTSRLSRYMPFKSFCLTTIKGQTGLYALIRSNEDRSKPLRTVKPSVRGKLKAPVETPASRQSAKKKERDL